MNDPPAGIVVDIRPVDARTRSVGVFRVGIVVKISGGRGLRIALSIFVYRSQNTSSRRRSASAVRRRLSGTGALRHLQELIDVTHAASTSPTLKLRE